jgi:DNA-binding NtrC family response regulator
MGVAVEGFTPSAMEALVHYKWPGNVRELRNVVERAALLVSGPLIDVDQLPAEVLSGSVPEPGRSSHGVDSTPGSNTLADVERSAILQAIQQFDGNKTKAAAVLGISRGTLRAKLKQYDLAGPEDENAPAEI